MKRAPSSPLIVKFRKPAGAVGYPRRPVLSSLLLCCSFQPCLSRLVERFIAGGEVTDGDDFIVDIAEVEVDEGGDLWFFLHHRGVGVNEERTGKGVAAILDVFLAGFDAFDAEDVELRLVFLVVGIAEEADGIGTAEDALDEDVVVFTELQVGGVENEVGS